MPRRHARLSQHPKEDRAKMEVVKTASVEKVKMEKEAKTTPEKVRKAIIGRTPRRTANRIASDSTPRSDAMEEVVLMGTSAQ